MKTVLAAATIATFAIAAPASAETILVVGSFSAPHAAAVAHANLEQRITSAVDGACEKPFLRDLKGQQLYRECRTEVRSEIEAKLARADKPATIALR